MSYERLIAEHDGIDRAITRLSSVIDDATPNVSSVLCALCDLGGELSRHLAHEDSFIYPKMILGDDRSNTRLAREFVTEFDDLRSDWNRYLLEWQSESISCDWSTFCRETTIMMRRLAHRVEREDNLIYAAAFRCGAFPLRQPA